MAEENERRFESEHVAERLAKSSWQEGWTASRGLVNAGFGLRKGLQGALICRCCGRHRMMGRLRHLFLETHHLIIYCGCWACSDQYKSDRIVVILMKVPERMQDTDQMLRCAYTFLSPPQGYLIWEFRESGDWRYQISCVASGR